MSFLLLIFFFLLFSYLLSKWEWAKQTGIKVNVLIVLFAVNVFAGFLLVYLYGTYYDPSSSDIYLYFNDALVLKRLLLNDSTLFWNIMSGHTLLDAEALNKVDQLQFWYSSGIDFFIHEKRTVILLNLVVSFFSLDQIYIHSLFMAFIGFIGQMAIFKFVRNRSAIDPVFILIVTFLLPTILLWTSSILKEPLIILSIGLGLLYTDRWLERKTLGALTLSLLFFGFGLLVKPYVILSLALPWFIFISFSVKTNLTFKKQSLIVFLSIVLISSLFWYLSLDHFNVFEKLSQKQADFIALIQQIEESEEVGSKIEYNRLGPTLPSLILNAPKAFVETMFSPSFYNIKSWLYLPDILQNLLILLFAFVLPARYQIPSRKQYPFLWLSVLFVIILFTSVGLVAPIVGALVRYKIPALSFVFYFLLSFMKALPLSKKWNVFLFVKHNKG